MIRRCCAWPSSLRREFILLRRLRQRARALKRQTYVLYFACRDPRTPWYAKAVAGAVVAYALSPIDLIPDFIPVLGYLDDVLIVPLGLTVALKLIPAPVLADCRAKADLAVDRSIGRRGAAVIIGIWLAVAALLSWVLWDALM